MCRSPSLSSVFSQKASGREVRREPALACAGHCGGTAHNGRRTRRASRCHKQVSVGRQREEPELGIGMAEKGFSFPVVHSRSVCSNYAEEFSCDGIRFFSIKIPEKNLLLFGAFFCFVCCFFFLFSRCLYFVSSTGRRRCFFLIPSSVPERDIASWCPSSLSCCTQQSFTWKCSH